MSDGEQQKRTARPLSCGEAWMAFFFDIVQVRGTTGTVAGDSHRAFEAGWDAAMLAAKESKQE